MSGVKVTGYCIMFEAKRSRGVAGSSEGEHCVSFNFRPTDSKQNMCSKQLSERRGEFLCFDLSVPVCFLVAGGPGIRSGWAEATFSVSELKRALSWARWSTA